ncbi:hypothetical protein LSH36_601g01027 [Paralvinella palmiformis]|uniref:Major facilitator superfamily (MFS) profile domain-containing protein n=1 Tax=Paralvinella palmiformis TaxID=53620 RepID=A0AAD9MUR9_9ANNE|nr:hypothetical protein LSH36_601g01027 [Paralvinella palmiformis]
MPQVSCEKAPNGASSSSPFLPSTSLKDSQVHKSYGVFESSDSGTQDSFDSCHTKSCSRPFSDSVADYSDAPQHPDYATSDSARLVQTKHQPSRSYRNEVISSVLCCFSNVAHGLAYGLASPATPTLISEGKLTPAQAPLFESLLTIGALVGGIAVGFLVGALGRKGTLLLAAAPFLLGWVCLAVTETYIVLYVGRLLTGIGYGLVAVVSPLYIVETVSKEIRGALTMGVTLASTSGILLQFCMGLVLDTRWLSIVSMTPLVIMVAGMIFMPESPRWLMMKGKYDAALEALTWLRRGTAEQVLEEFKEIAGNVENAEYSGVCSKCKSYSRKEVLTAVKSISICCILFAFQQLSGTTPIIFNAQDIFYAVGFTSSAMSSGQIPAIILAAVKMVTTIGGIFLVDRLGRRPLFIGCGLAMGVTCIITGLYFAYQSYLISNYAWLPLLALVLYEAAFSIAWGGIPWLLLSEIPPANVRGIASVAGSTATRISAFIVTQGYSSIVEAINMSGTFWLFGSISIAGSLFAWKFMPETKHKSLECIEHELNVSVPVRTHSVL